VGLFRRVMGQLLLKVQWIVVEPAILWEVAAANIFVQRRMAVFYHIPTTNRRLFFDNSEVRRF